MEMGADPLHTDSEYRKSATFRNDKKTNNCFNL